MTTARVFDLQRFSVHDGPGIRTTVFLKGCPLRCRWCQNPEGLERGISLWHFENLCGRSGHCEEVCPTRAISLTPTGVEINHAACTLCGDCVDVCPRNALAFDGRDVTTEEVIEEVGRDAIFHEVSGGGVTFSGGEPLAQAAFVRETAAAAKGAGCANDPGVLVPRTLVLDRAADRRHRPVHRGRQGRGSRGAPGRHRRVERPDPREPSADSPRRPPRIGTDPRSRAARPALHGDARQPRRDRRPRRRPSTRRCPSSW